MTSIATFLTYASGAEEAARFYCSLFDDSEIGAITRVGPGADAPVLTVEFTLMGRPYVAMNGGPQFAFEDGASLAVSCDSQDEIDRLWEALTADGGEERVCGWLNDRFGMRWQVYPSDLLGMIRDPDAQASQRAMMAMQSMVKFDMAALRAAHAGEA